MLKVVGVKFVAEGYSNYIRDLQQVQKVQKATFKKQRMDTDFKDAAAAIEKDSKRVASALKSAGVAVDKFQGDLTAVASSGMKYAAAANAIVRANNSIGSSMDTSNALGKLRDRLASAGTSSTGGLGLADRLSAARGTTPTMAAPDTSGVSAAYDATMKLRSASMDTSNALGKLRSAFQMPQIQSFASSIKSGAVGLLNFGKGLYAQIPGFLKWAGVLTMVMKVWEFFKQSGDIAQRNETLAVTLNTMGEAAGYTKTQIDAAVVSLKNQGITTSAASQSLIRMSRANISWAEASKLAAIAQGAAVAAGMNSSEAFERLILGVQKMEPELLDELGITLQRSQAYKAFAKDLGVSETALTQQQKQQAILNEIYRQSEPVLGVYDAAMETSGKKQGSLARHIEETQASLGKLMLPFEEVSIEMQTNFWKGLRLVATGLESWIPIIRGAVAGFQKLGQAGGALLGLVNPLFALGSVGEETFDTMGRGAHDWARITVESGAIVLAAWDTIVEKSEVLKKSLMTDWIEWANLITSPISTIAGKAIASFITGEDMKILPGNLGEEMGESFAGNFTKALADVKKVFPDVFKSWEEVSKDFDPTGIDLNPPTDASTESLAEQAELLQQQLEIYKQIDKIVEDYNSKVKSANQDYAKSLADLNVNSAKQEQDLRTKTEKAMSKAASDGAKQRQKLIEDANKSRLKEEQRANKELERERKRFQLEQIHSFQQFKLSETRLIAEGDVLGVKELREDYALQEKQSQENFDQSQEFAKEDAREQQQLQQENLQQQLRDLDESIAERQMELQQSYVDELAAQQQANAERKAELDLHLQEELEALAAARNQQLTDLGTTLQEEGKITEEGMKTIYSKMAEVLGENGPADALMKGFSTRAKTAFSEMISSITKQLNNLGDAVDAIGPSSSSGGLAGGGEGLPPFSGSRSSLLPTQMREGGSGIVTGPATFSVEPGQREAVMFAPLPTASNKGSVDVNMSGGFDITGAEVAGRAATEAALNRMVEEFSIAVKLLGRR